MSVKIEKLPKSRVRITASPSADQIKTAIELSLKKLGQEIDIPGYRKGKAPAEMVKDRINETKLALEALDQLATLMFREAIQKNNLWPVSKPEVNIPDQEKILSSLTESTDKLSTITIEYSLDVKPEIKMDDYTLAVDKPSIMIKESEIEEALQNLFKEWKGNQEQKKEPQIETASTLTEAKHKANQDQRQSQENIAKAVKSAPDDEWAQMIGEPDLASLKQKVKGLLMDIKRGEAEKEFEQKIFDHLIAQVTDLEIPESLTNQQLEREEEMLKRQLEQSNSSLDDFLKETNQSLEDIRAKWKTIIERNYRIDFILDHLADKEDIQVEESEVEQEIDLIKDSKLKKEFDNDDRKAYIKFILTRRKVVAWLKDQVEKGDKTTATKNKKDQGG